MQPGCKRTLGIPPPARDARLFSTGGAGAVCRRPVQPQSATRLLRFDSLASMHASVVQDVRGALDEMGDNFGNPPQEAALWVRDGLRCTLACNLDRHRRRLVNRICRVHRGSFSVLRIKNGAHSALTQAPPRRSRLKKSLAAGNQQDPHCKPSNASAH